MKLVDMNVTQFITELASDSPAPGGGSVSALNGALAAGLAAMVGGLTISKEKLADKWDIMRPVAEEGQKLANKALDLIDKDTDSFNSLMEAFKLPKSTDEEKATRSAAIQEATVLTIEVPMETLKLCVRALELTRIAVEHGNPNAVTDGATGAQMARAGAIGAAYNAKINCMGLKNREKAQAFLNDVDANLQKVSNLIAEIEAMMEKNLAQ